MLSHPDQPSKELPVEGVARKVNEAPHGKLPEQLVTLYRKI
jgi:hypothetical protein